MKSFCFTIDDNTRCLREIVQNNTSSLFEHPYLALLRTLHIKYGVKIQLNLFYQDQGFDLSMMSDRYGKEWEENADWLKLSFHSFTDTRKEYENADYERVYRDCEKTHKEILRFAGEKSLAKTTTIHWCVLTKDGVKAMQDLGVKGLLGLFGTDEKPRLSYDCNLEDSKLGRKGQIIRKHGMAYAGIDCVMNSFTTEEVLDCLERLKDREQVRIMIHEQYFYPDYEYYQAEFGDKISKAIQSLQAKGFVSKFLEEMI